MGAVGGDLRDITFNHPTLGTGTFYTKGAEDHSINPGGFITNDDANQIDSSGEAIFQMNRVRWMFEGTVSWDSKIRKEDKILSQLASDPIPAEWTFTYHNGTVKAGTGKPVGDIAPNGNTAVVPLKISGGGKLEDIV